MVSRFLFVYLDEIVVSDAPLCNIEKSILLVEDNSEGTYTVSYKKRIDRYISHTRCYSVVSQEPVVLKR